MIHLYAIDIQSLPDPKEEPRMLRYLHGGRKIQTMKYMQADDRRRSLGAGILLAEALPRYGARPEDITLGPEGKPQVEGIYFNLSHSVRMAVCAVGKQPVGCDVEKIDKEPDKMADHFFHPGETDLLHRCETKRRDELFFRLWTLKESYLKMTGEGLRLPLNSFEILIGQEEVRVRRDGEILPCHIREYPVPGYKLSVCALENRFAEHIVYINPEQA